IGGAMTRPEELRIVVFAGHPDPAAMLRMAVRGAGVRDVWVASSPEDTVRAFGEGKPDVFVVHIGADENDPGLRMIRFIRRWDGSPNPRIPIVAASSRRDVGVVDAVRNAGGHELVLLPAAGDELMRKITTAVQGN